jgi:hypothetical protein
VAYWNVPAAVKVRPKVLMISGMMRPTESVVMANIMNMTKVSDRHWKQDLELLVQDLDSTSRSKPTAFEAVSFQQVFSRARHRSGSIWPSKPLPFQPVPKR